MTDHHYRLLPNKFSLLVSEPCSYVYPYYELVVNMTWEVKIAQLLLFSEFARFKEMFPQKYANILEERKGPE